MLTTTSEPKLHHPLPNQEYIKISSAQSQEKFSKFHLNLTKNTLTEIRLQCIECSTPHFEVCFLDQFVILWIVISIIIIIIIINYYIEVEYLILQTVIETTVNI